MAAQRNGTWQKVAASVLAVLAAAAIAWLMRTTVAHGNELAAQKERDKGQDTVISVQLESIKSSLKEIRQDLRRACQ